MPSEKKIYWTLGILLLVSAIIRGLIAASIELGNDEVYYWTYACYPDLSHFDHPPMVGLVMQFFTLNLLLDSEFFLRLASVVLGTLSTFLIFLIGKEIKNSLTGLYAAFLYTASFYGFILSGTFILPDTPQGFFWLGTMYLLTRSLPDENLEMKSRNFLFAAGVIAGFALLSKYHSFFLLAGVFMYIILYHPKWLLVKETYLAFLVSILIFSPVVIWNADHGFISFTFHENRVDPAGSGIKIQYFLTELVGQFFYNNPVNIIIIISAFFGLLRGKRFLEVKYLRLILWTSLPLLIIFTGFSLFRSTLPHWTGPAYFGLILVASAYLAHPKSTDQKKHLIPWPIVISLCLLFGVATVAVTQIRYGWIPLKKWKVDDVTTDLAGWKQLGDKFAPLAKWDEDHYLVAKNSPILTFRWFPAANFDYYIGRRIHKNVFAIGELERIHKYFWINKTRGNLRKGSDAWYIALSDDYEDPEKLYGKSYEIILPSDTIPILRGKDTIRLAYVYRLLGRKDDLIFTPSDTVRKSKFQTQTDTLIYLNQQIRSDPTMMKILEKRARQQGLQLDDMIRMEALRIMRGQPPVILPVTDTLKH